MAELSQAAGPSDAELIRQTIGDHLAQRVATHRDAEALVSCHQAVRQTYGELHGHVERAARALLALGIERGDRVGIWSSNCAEWLIMQYATAWIGAILVAIHPAYRRRELEFALDDAGVTLLLAAEGFRETEYRAILHRLAPGLLEDGRRRASDGLPHLRTVVHLGRRQERAGLSWEEMLAGGARVPAKRLRQIAVSPDAPAAILYTSGTTGAPRGATLSHQALLNCGLLIGDRLRYGAEDRICLPVPLYHAFGCVVGNLAALTHGSAIVLPTDIFEPLACLRAIEAERCTAVYGVPTMFIALLEHPALADHRLDSLRTGIMAGATCPAELMRRLIDRLHLPGLTVSFGMTETLATLHTGLDDPFDRRISTVGTPLPHVECQIVDPADDRVLPRGTIGELRTRSYGQMLGYWNNEAATAATVDAGSWVRTGDLAVMDDGGYVAIVGRLKDVVIRAGEKVYPAEIEDYLYTHPGVEEVHVFGVEDPDYGEELCAWIKLRRGKTATAAEIRRHCRQAIAGFKTPRFIRFVDDFPRTASGKAQKFRMREVMAAELGLADSPRHRRGDEEEVSPR